MKIVKATNNKGTITFTCPVCGCSVSITENQLPAGNLSRNGSKRCFMDSCTWGNKRTFYIVYYSWEKTNEKN